MKIRCASCGSKNVSVSENSEGYDVKKGLVGTALMGTGGAVMGVNGKKQKYYHCNECGELLNHCMAPDIAENIDKYIEQPAIFKFMLVDYKKRYKNIEWEDTNPSNKTYVKDESRLAKLEEEYLDDIIDALNDKVHLSCAEMYKYSPRLKAMCGDNLNELLALLKYLASKGKIQMFKRNGSAALHFCTNDQNVEEIKREMEKTPSAEELYKASLNNKSQVPAKNGCYVATLVYGSYDCPEVWTLRRFRDDYLDNKFFGRMFIKIYYLVSPKLVNLFKGNKKFISFNRNILDKWVAKLNKDGYRNTEYKDKY